jgi:hypothetical protein
MFMDGQVVGKIYFKVRLSPLPRKMFYSGPGIPEGGANEETGILSAIWCVACAQEHVRETCGQGR